MTACLIVAQSLMILVLLICWRIKLTTVLSLSVYWIAILLKHGIRPTRSIAWILIFSLIESQDADVARNHSAALAVNIITWRFERFHCLIVYNR